jgi:transferase CAF17, mitochondrial
MMYDVFIYNCNNESGQSVYYVECDGQIQERVFLHLQTFNLRTKTSIKMVPEDACALFFSSVPLEGSMGSVEDKRSDWSFKRFLFSKANLPSDKEASFTEARYNRERLLRGVPEGAFEIQSRQAIPLEFNVDLMGGIDFHKGCYLGQELVARTHHRGVVRKRILPLRFHALDAASGKPLREDSNGFSFLADSLLTRNLDKQNEFLATKIDSEGKLLIPSRSDTVGKLVFAHGNIGIGMMRLDALKQEENRTNLATLDHVESNWVLADASIPAWWPLDNVFENV